MDELKEQNNKENKENDVVCDKKTDAGENDGVCAGEKSKSDRKEKVVTFLKGLPKRWFITAFSGMAQGLFCTLIAGTIIWQVGIWIGDNTFGKMLVYAGNLAKTLMGAGIGIGIANALKKGKLITFTSAVTGLIGAFSQTMVEFGFAYPNITVGAPGNPIGAYVAALFAMEIASLYEGKTKLDIIFIPLGMIIMSLGGIYLAYPFILLVNVIGKGVGLATGKAPVTMGIIVSVCMGILLTLPTSSAAIWLSIASGITTDSMLLAGGAAACGCASHMIGFAVSSFRENKFGGLIAQGLGTSMLQIPNLMKKPIIMVPEIIASAIVGPLSTKLFGLKCNASGGGMGTSGLVGVFNTITESINGGVSTLNVSLGVILCMFVIPAVVAFGVSELMRKLGWIKYGDMKLDV